MSLLVGFRRALALAIVAATFATPVVAQVSTFDLSGTALDPSAAVLPGATVVLKM